MTTNYLGDRRIIASVSGGKDSTAMCLHLRELGLEDRIERVFLDTGWEHPLTYEYLRGPLTEAIGPIIEVKAPLGMADLCRKKGMFPSRVIRFCTQELKVFPMQRYIAAREDDTVNAVGIRAAESRVRSRLSEWEWSDGFDCETWRPLLQWSEQDVIDIHARHGLAPNPLYLLGAERVGCWPCIYARKEELRFLAENDPGRIEQIAALERDVGEAALVRHVARGGAPAEFHPPSWFQARLADGGKYPSWPIEKVVDWARTSRGGRQFELFDSTDRDVGCMRWGLCDTGSTAHDALRSTAAERSE